MVNVDVILIEEFFFLFGWFVSLLVDLLWDFIILLDIFLLVLLYFENVILNIKFLKKLNEMFKFG